MNDERLASVWRSQESQILKMDDKLMESLRDEYRREERRVVWMYVQEVLPAAVLFLIFGGCGLAMETGKWAMFTAALLFFGIGAFLVSSLVRQRKRQSAYGESVREEIERSLSQVKHREWLFRNIFWWYLLPGSIGWGVVVYEKMLSDGVSTFDIFYVAVALVFFSWVYWGNRRFAATRFSTQQKIYEDLINDFELCE